MNHFRAEFVQSVKFCFRKKIDKTFEKFVKHEM